VLPRTELPKGLRARLTTRAFAIFHRGQSDTPAPQEEDARSSLRPGFKGITPPPPVDGNGSQAPEPLPDDNASQPLRQLAVRGGAYLVGREGIGMVIRLAGVVLTLRLIGPSSYGIYAGAAAFTLVVTSMAQMGAEVYLIKMPEAPPRESYDQVFTFVLVASLVIASLAFALTFILGGLLRPVGVVVPLRVMLIGIPINTLWAPAQARIERGFGYKKMGILEVGGDLVLYGVAVPLAFLGAGAWSLVAGYLAWQSFLLVGSYAYSGLRPRLRWSKEKAIEFTKFGFSYSTTNWIGLLGGLANPLVVGQFFGPAGVGYVAFAQRLVDVIGFAKGGAYRLGLVAMSRVPDEQKHRLRRAIEEGSELQLIALGAPFAIFGVLAPKAIPLLFGQEWKGAIHLYSLLALGTFFGASGLMQTTLLYSRGRNYIVATAAFIQSIILAGSAIFFVHQFGIIGWGYASLLALIDLIYLDRKTRSIVTFGYRNYFLVSLTFAPLVAYPLVPFPLSLIVFAPLIVFILVPATRRAGLSELAIIKSAFSRSNGIPEEVAE
jgi:O-antigen/teichoic acid export membrane protein